MYGSYLMDRAGARMHDEDRAAGDSKAGKRRCGRQQDMQQKQSAPERRAVRRRRVWQGSRMTVVTGTVGCIALLDGLGWSADVTGTRRSGLLVPVVEAGRGSRCMESAP